ncbi:hypothetical protein [Trichloromonas sp.]|uniref:hypothetical protein n=1 Tax=Trichloromonas sp. TaxID=3069249 RepID=UPI002A43F243|nr:hypothetical protein [Trichloromonas sp.]
MDKEIIRKKWEPIIEMQIEPIKLDYQTEVEISVWVERYMASNIEHERRISFLTTSFKKYRNLLLTDKGYSINVIKTFYNPLINEICYELENGEVIINNKKYETQISSDYRINLFYSIVDPGNPKLRNLKINKLINGR